MKKVKESDIIKAFKKEGELLSSDNFSNIMNAVKKTDKYLNNEKVVSFEEPKKVIKKKGSFSWKLPFLSGALAAAVAVPVLILSTRGNTAILASETTLTVSTSTTSNTTAKTATANTVIFSVSYSTDSESNVDLSDTYSENENGKMVLAAVKAKHSKKATISATTFINDVFSVSKNKLLTSASGYVFNLSVACLSEDQLNTLSNNYEETINTISTSNMPIGFNFDTIDCSEYESVEQYAIGNLAEKLFTVDGEYLTGFEFNPITSLAGYSEKGLSQLKGRLLELYNKLGNDEAIATWQADLEGLYEIYEERKAELENIMADLEDAGGTTAQTVNELRWYSEGYFNQNYQEDILTPFADRENFDDLVFESGDDMKDIKTKMDQVDSLLRNNEKWFSNVLNLTHHMDDVPPKPGEEGWHNDYWKPEGFDWDDEYLDRYNNDFGGGNQPPEGNPPEGNPPEGDMPEGNPPQFNNQNML